MKTLASEMKFEEAQRIKDKIDVLENYQVKTTIVNPKINNVDVFQLFLTRHSPMLIFFSFRMVQ